MTARHRSAVALVTIAALVAVLAPMSAAPVGAAGELVARGSITQVSTWGHAPGTSVELLDAGAAVIATASADTQGAVLFREVTPGTGYVVRTGGGTSDPVAVTAADDHPDAAFYDAIDLDEGYTYIPTRDGTLLSATIQMPLAGAGPGPLPTVVTYSGYDPSQPGALLPEALPYLLLGYVVVAVNMRGTGCSGGAFDYFEAATGTDGYDVIEAVAAQDWSNGRVGMVGISYSGISQLYVAATQPPHLSAITPLSPYADAYRGILYPGGVRNEGFALEWALDRQAASRPRARQWVRDQIAQGDTTCDANQTLRLQSRDIAAEIPPERFDMEAYEYLSISSFAEDIEVPTYLSVQFQDEQTGGSAAFLADLLQADGKIFRANFGNGAHADPLGPTEFPRVLEFIDLYVGQKVPDLSVPRQLAPDLLRGIFEDPIDLPADRFTGMTYPDALAIYEAEDPVRVRFEVGGVEGREGAPYETATGTYDAWPVPGTAVDRWYLQPDGGLSRTAPAVPAGTPRATSAYRDAPGEVNAPTYEGKSKEAMWKRHPAVDWRSPAEGDHLTFTTPAATDTSVYAGSGSVDLWLRSSGADTDLEAVITEVRPDGQEVYVQSGWLRASHRALDVARSTPLRPWATHLEADAAPMPAGELVPVRMELFPFAHVVRPGSRLRLSIQAPGGNQPFWKFTPRSGSGINEVAHSAGQSSSVALPLISDAALLAELPPTAPSCSVPGVTTQSQSLRLQPCRADRAPRRATDVSISGPAATAGTDATVDWTPPLAWADGATPTGYEIAIEPGGISVSAPAGATSASVSGLPLGVAVTATVTPTYASGGGVTSDASPTYTAVPRSGNASFVTAIHHDFLGRPPTSAELASGVTALEGGTSRRSLARTVASSEAWIGHIVDQMYLDTLGRPGDAAGRAYWIQQIIGGQPVAKVAASFYGSAEYFAGAGGGSSATWVRDLYVKLLGRTGSASEHAYWVERTAARGRGWVALQMFQAPESAAVRVQGLYASLLGRSASAADAAYWGPRVVRDGDVTLAVDLAASAEYLTRARTRFP